MANNIREVKNRINSTKNTAQITKAMNMVSASKLRGAERSIREYRPFIEKAKEIIANIASSSEKLQHTLLKKRQVKKVCYVLITSDKGLAGAFNSNVCKELTKTIKESEYPSCVLALGNRAYAYCKKMNYEMLNEHAVSLRDDVSFDDVYIYTHDLVMNYLMRKFDQVKVIYNHYVNTLNQIPDVKQILPINKKELLDDVKESKKINYEFDGGIDDILNIVLPIYLENYLYGLILDSKASEHASRMNSMKTATDNATEIISSLELLYNRARQSAITLELTDIVGGASVINQN